MRQGAGRLGFGSAGPVGQPAVKKRQTFLLGHITHQTARLPPPAAGGGDCVKGLFLRGHG